MEFSATFLEDFLQNIVAFNRKSSLVFETMKKTIETSSSTVSNGLNTFRVGIQKEAADICQNQASQFERYQQFLNEALTARLNNADELFNRLQRCKELRAKVDSAESSIVEADTYRSYQQGNLSSSAQIDLEGLLANRVDFISLAYEVNTLLMQAKRRESGVKMAYFATLCHTARNLLDAEMTKIRTSLAGKVPAFSETLVQIGETFYQDEQEAWKRTDEDFTSVSKRVADKLQQSAVSLEQDEAVAEKRKEQELQKLKDSFFAQFPPQALMEIYADLYSLEPSFLDYQCKKEMLKSLRIGTFAYDVSDLHLNSFTANFLTEYYPYIFQNRHFYLPSVIPFDKEFNLLFRFNANSRSQAIENACNLGMRLFMMLPPCKLNFTFLDPVTLGESFAMFTRLVDVNDRTSEVINGRIWSSPDDIQAKLKTMTEHISNITQRCLRGKYKNIYDYNADVINPEAYHVVMLMDFPAGLTEASLKLLEQIVTSGPKCGVFTIIYWNENQYAKMPEKLRPFVDNIEINFQNQKFKFEGTDAQVVFLGEIAKKRPLFWKSCANPTTTQLDSIISVLREGIKNPDFSAPMIGLDDLKGVEAPNNTKSGIKIPIGIRGGNQIQYLTLGEGGSHHVLVGGLIRMGKSSLLRTITVQALRQYRSSDEILLYLLDFKRGVEARFYTPYILPSLRMIAMEVEREFGLCVLRDLERELTIRADKFKRRYVTKIEEYRDLGEKMPRILVIMDEIQELFVDKDDGITKEALDLLRRIALTGAAFGIHLILSTQTYANVPQLTRTVMPVMAVRIVLKCPPDDAGLLLEDGKEEVKLLPMNRKGPAIYNSEAGNREYSSLFQIAYVDPKDELSAVLEEVGLDSRYYKTSPTRILLSNIEENAYSIFNQFQNYPPDMCSVLGRLYLGEPLSIANDMKLDFQRNEYSNLLMIGANTDKARSMFAFAMLSLAINYRVAYGKPPDEPFIYFLNYKPLQDGYFIDEPATLAMNLLPMYIKNIPVHSPDEVKSTVDELFKIVDHSETAADLERYLFVFGYQAAKDLKSQEKAIQQQDFFSTMSQPAFSPSNADTLSIKEKIDVLLTKGPQNGVHCVFWQDNFQNMDLSDRKMISYFYLKIAFDMSKDELSQFIGGYENLPGENNATFSNRFEDAKNFRPYQRPNPDWLKGICEKLT